MYSPISNNSVRSSPTPKGKQKKQSPSAKRKNIVKSPCVKASKIIRKSPPKVTPTTSVNKTTLACLIKRKLFPASSIIMANPPLFESPYCYHCSFPCKKPPHPRCLLVVNRIRNTISTFFEQSVELGYDLSADVILNYLLANNLINEEQKKLHQGPINHFFSKWWTRFFGCLTPVLTPQNSKSA